MSEDQGKGAVTTAGQKIAIGREWWGLQDNSKSIDYVDFVTEARQFNGVIHLAMGAGVQDANNVGVIHVTTRLRMNLAAAQVLHNLLGGMISEALKPSDKSQTN